MKSQKIYQDWINSRNKVLEDVFNYYRLKINDRFRIAFSNIVTAFILNPTQPNVSGIIADTAIDVGNIIKEMRQYIYDLSYASSLELMAGLNDKTISSNRPFLNPEFEMLSGGRPEFRVVFYLNRIIRKMYNEVERITLLDERITKEDLERMLPRAKKLDQARKPVRKLTLKKNDLGLKEAKKKKPDLSSTLIDDATWDNILKGYKEDYQTPHNPRDFIVGGKLQDELDDALVYSWEVDQDLTDEFMRQVNDSQEAAFEKAGLTKFVWIAVLDNRTCQECCVWRDGLTIEEIEAALKSGRKGDKCQSLKPPAHPNCRCTLAPAFDNLPERPNSNLKEFEEWLED